MELLIFFYYSLVVVAVVCTGSDIDPYLQEYRLAPKLYHRKIRSSSKDVPAAMPSTTELPEVEIQIKPQSSYPANKFESSPHHETADSLLLTPTAVGSSNDSSFLLDLPYPSHFLFSLQLLNISLPFLGDDISIPEDPPTPEIKLSEVIGNPQYLRPEGYEKDNGPSEIRVGEGGRRVVNRVRNRIPSPPFRRLPKRSPPILTEPTPRKPLIFRSWNASNPGTAQRRLELYSKNRPTTTTRPAKPIKKFQSQLLDRRANATKNSLKTQISTQAAVTENIKVESNTQNPLDYDVTTAEQLLVLPSNENENSDGRIQETISSFEPKKSGVTLVSGFRPGGRNGVSSSKSISASTEINYVITTTEVYPSRIDFPPPRAIGTPAIPKLHPLKQYISQFDSSESNAESSELSDTQLQKPDLETKHTKSFVEQSSSDDEILVSATSTSIPAVSDTFLNLTFPSFELPSEDGSKSAPRTLPPPLSIEELIKKFTGSDPIPDTTLTIQPPVFNVTPPSIATNFATVQTSTADPIQPTSDLNSLEKLEASLKQLLAATTTTTPSAIKSLLEPTKPSTSHSASSSSNSDHPVLPSPTIISTTQSTQFASPEFNPATKESKHSAHEKNSFGSDSVGSIKLFSPPSSTPPSTGALSGSSSLESVSKLDTSNQSVSVQRGPLDISSFEGSNFGLTSGISPGGFQQQSPFNFQSIGFQQQLPVYQDASFGGVVGGGGGGQQPYQFNNVYGSLPSSGQSYQEGFDGTLSLSPTGPAVGEFNAITQGLSLLASFGGGGGGGGSNQNQYLIQQPGAYQSFGDFSHHQSPSLQASSHYSQGYPSFNNVIQQPQYPQYSQSSYQQVAPYQQIAQQQQLFAPVQQQGGNYQLVQQQGGYPVQQVQPGVVIQQVPNHQALVYQSLGSTSIPSNQQVVNPSQFGTLLTGVQTASDLPSTPVGTAAVSVSSSSTDGATTNTGGKSPDASASQLVEIHLNPAKTSPSYGEDIISQPIILIGPPAVNSKNENTKPLTKKTVHVKGLHSGYYS